MIKTSELKRFLPHMKNIKGKSIIPILDFVKIECKDNRATLTKTNLSSFVIFEVEAEFKGDQSILVEEHVLTACSNYSEGEYVTIAAKDGKGVILDDGIKKLQSQYEDVKNFPSTDISLDEEVSFDQEIISALSIAKNHVALTANGFKGWTGFVHSVHINKSSYIVGVNGMISYFRKFKNKIPEFSLDPETVVIIGRFPEVSYMTSDKWDYFRHNGVVYGFLKAETSRPDFTNVVASFKATDSFTIRKSDIYNFCDMVASSLNNQSIPPEVSITDDGEGGVILKYTDISGIERAGQKVRVIDKNFNVAEILFQPKNLITVMKDLDADEVKISKTRGNMIVSSKDEPEYTGTIMELAKP